MRGLESVCPSVRNVNNALEPVPAVALGMTYRNLTPEALAKLRQDQLRDPNASAKKWPWEEEPKKRKKLKARGRTARGKIARTFKPGGGRLS